VDIGGAAVHQINIDNSDPHRGLLFPAPPTTDRQHDSVDRDRLPTPAADCWNGPLAASSGPLPASLVGDDDARRHHACKMIDRNSWMTSSDAQRHRR